MDLCVSRLGGEATQEAVLTVTRFKSNYDWRGGGRGGPGGRGPSWWQRVFAGDNPLTWSIPFGRVAGISLRVSIIYVVWMAFELATTHHWSFKVSYVGALFILVLLHELGHCFACRRVGGEADDVLMWMLGGLAYCRPPHNWWASLITTAGGPGVNLALVPVFMGILMALGVPLSALLFNPFSGSAVSDAWLTCVSAIHTRQGVGGFAVPDWLPTPLFALHLTNLALLLFNVLLPMFPMDGGRLLQAVLWRRLGFSKSMWIATTVGLVCAPIVGLFGLITSSWLLVGLAVMCGLTCYQQRQQLRFIAESGGGIASERWAQFGADGEGWKGGGGDGGVAREAKVHSGRALEKARKAAEAERARALADTAELDRILAKIKEKGMASLSKSEEAFLRRSTQKSRGGGG